MGSQTRKHWYVFQDECFIPTSIQPNGGSLCSGLTHTLILEIQLEEYCWEIRVRYQDYIRRQRSVHCIWSTNTEEVLSRRIGIDTSQINGAKMETNEIKHVMFWLLWAQDFQFALIFPYVATKKTYFVGINPQLKKDSFKVCVVRKNTTWIKGRLITVGYNFYLHQT